MSMNVHDFIRKWSQVALTERSASQQHFLDLCEILGHPKPAEADPEGESFTFEKGAAKYGGGSGWADVWKRGFFAWEYKRRHADLAGAYDQLLRYREALENPPLLVVCDMGRIVVHTNFTNRPAIVHDIALKDLAKPENLEIVRAVFFDPKRLEPGTTREAITQEAASRIGDIAKAMRARGLDSHDVARFLDRIVFALFAQDVNLLPEKIFTRLLKNSKDNPELFARFVSELFRTMAHGGFWGADLIRHFNGNLFNDGPVLTPTRDELKEINKAAKLHWSAIDPSVFGTLFERGMDPDKRSQLGAHYTSREDIETLVEPVVMQPLRREWTEVRRVVENLLATGKKDPTDKERAKHPAEGLQGPLLRKARLEADLLLRRFWERLSKVQVLDPACGSGNFLYVTLQKLKDLEKELILYAMDRSFPGFPPIVGPWQLHGIEINPYAFELAQMSVWIGYLQWIRHNGFGEPEDPVLRPMDTFECRDAILDLSDPENPKEPEWPKVDFIVGNPPFLGGKKLRAVLGDEYVARLFALWDERVPAEADLCCYWFEKARSSIERGFCRRTGLLATQGIRGGANRIVLNRIKQSGDIFFAESDRDWFLEGATVHVSMVGFDAGQEALHVLDGKEVAEIHANLSATVNVASSHPIVENLGIAFMGDTKGGKFNITLPDAVSLLREPNPHGVPNSDVLRPWFNVANLILLRRELFIVDFGISFSEADAARYSTPFALLMRDVKEERGENRREIYKTHWWRHVEPRPGMRVALRDQPRFLATPRVSKFRLFVWLDAPTLPDHQLIVFSRSDDFFFGILHSRLHEIWALRLGTRLETRPRYTPTTTFETFPFPRPTPAQESAIGAAAKELDDLRTRWLNPPEWTREEILEFPGSVNGPWARFLHDPDARGIGTVRYPRLVPKDDEAAAKLKARTLTNLYNQRPTWLDLAHRKLDEAVFAAYGWDPGISDEEILERLLALNLERAGA
jgi:type II restriction/modification system DNA methylase subunit YeeA